MRLRKPLEKDIQRQCRDWLTLVGVFVVRINSGAVTATTAGKSRFVRFNDQPGCSDLLCVLGDGRFAAIEVKRPGGKLNDAQRSFLAEVSKRGGIALVVSSLDQLQEALRLEGYDL